MTDSGYILLSKSLLNWKWYQKPETVQLFLTMLLLANWEDTQYEDKSLKRGQFITTTKRLSAITGLSEKQVRTSRDRLVKTGEISIKSANKFTLVTVEKYDLYQSFDSYSGNQTANKGQTKGKPTNYIKTNKTNKTNIYAHFDAFWTAYPKKKGKESAKKAWEKISPDDELVETILSAVERQKESNDWKKDKGQFIPYPATWLNGHRWEDEVEEQLSDLERWALSDD